MATSKVNNVATHVTVKGNKKRIVERFNDEDGQFFIVKSMTGKILRTYRKKEMAKFNKKYKSIAVKNNEKTIRDRD